MEDMLAINDFPEFFLDGFDRCDIGNTRQQIASPGAVVASKIT
jgi:hypothetical protein